VAIEELAKWFKDYYKEKELANEPKKIELAWNCGVCHSTFSEYPHDGTCPDCGMTIKWRLQ